MRTIASLLPGSLLPKAAAALLALTAVAAAQDYPTKPVRIVVPFPPGAINDTVGRMVGNHLSNRLGKQFVVENRAGAGGVVGAELVANAPKDGHTLLVVSLAITVNPWLYTLPYDHAKAWAPVAVVARTASCRFVPKVCVRSLPGASVAAASMCRATLPTANVRVFSTSSIRSIFPASVTSAFVPCQQRS